MDPLIILEKAVDINKYNKIINENLEYPKPYSDEVWDKSNETFFTDDHQYKTVITCEKDMKIIEDLLNAPKGFFSTPYVIKTKCENCPSCQRKNNFLDVVATGLKVHKPEFLLDVFTGKYGKIINSAKHQRCICYDCGNILPVDSTKFSAPLNSKSENANYRFEVQ